MTTHKLKIALMGSFPIYPFRDKIKFWNNRPDLTTTWNYNLAYALARIPELDVHFVTMAPLWKTKVLKDEGLTIHFVGHLPKLDKWDNLTDMRYSCSVLRRYLRKLKPDLIHGSGTDHEYAYVAATSKTPNVITVHGVMKENAVKAPPPKGSVVWQYIRHEPLAIKAAKHLISINPYVEQQFPEFKGKVYRIENPISPSFFSSKGEPRHDFVFVGKMNERKRVLNLLEAVLQIKERHPGLTVKLIGGGEAAYIEKIHVFIKEHGLEGGVEFVGPLQQDEVAMEIAGAKCLVLPSIEETAPMVIAEAQAMGTPVVATDVGGVKHMVKDGESGFVVPPDRVDVLTERLATILDDHELRKKMSVSARRAAQAYHPDEVARKTVACYQQIMESQISGS
jgi:glycosyltransferase involved in cell wall biosynthesis